MSNDAAARWYPRTTLVATLILMAALSRLLPHPPNFTPVEAIGLFAGAYLADRRLAFVVPLVAMALADLVLGLHSGMPVIYGLIAFTVWLGLRLGPDPAAGRVAAYGFGAATVFFVVSNFAVWAAGAGHYYTHDMAGLVSCYTLALPFFAYSLAGMAVYASVLFGGMALIRRRQIGQLAA
jgi:hypothetical protein